MYCGGVGVMCVVSYQIGDVDIVVVFVGEFWMVQICVIVEYVQVDVCIGQFVCIGYVGIDCSQVLVEFEFIGMLVCSIVGFVYDWFRGSIDVGSQCCCWYCY